MKNMLLLAFLLLVHPPVYAGWFESDPDPLPDYRQKITTLEHQLSAQTQTLDLWQIAAGSLGLGCALFFIIGTALGAKTRNHHDGTRRMGAPPQVNGRKPKVMGATSENDLDTTLAA